MVPFDLKGGVQSHESVTLSLKNVRLEEILRKLLRGYNYVLVMGEDKKPLVIIVGKAERSKYLETRSEPSPGTASQTQMPPASPNPLIPPPFQIPAQIDPARSEKSEAEGFTQDAGQFQRFPGRRGRLAVPQREEVAPIIVPPSPPGVQDGEVTSSLPAQQVPRKEETQEKSPSPPIGSQ